MLLPKAACWEHLSRWQGIRQADPRAPGEGPENQGAAKKALWRRINNSRVTEWSDKAWLLPPGGLNCRRRWKRDNAGGERE